MRFILSVIFLSALITPDATHCQDRSLFISPLLSYDTYRTSGFDYGIDYGAAAGVHITPSISLSASAAFGRRTLTFDVIGGTESIGARLTQVGASLEVRLLGREGGPHAAATAGAGRISSTVDPHTVSLGALGSVTIPGHSNARTFILAGITGEIPLSADVAVVILPSVRLFTPLSSAAEFSLAGGLRVGIL